MIFRSIHPKSKRNYMNIHKLIILIILSLSAVSGYSQKFPEPMQPKRLVNDYTGLFSKKETSSLEEKLSGFNKSSSTQIAVVTISSLEGYDINDYAARLAEKWGIGQKGKDNGVLILIKPRKGNEKGQVAISVGYGLEGVIPDVTASRIIRNEIIPSFQQGNYYLGINKATNVLMDLTKGEFTAEEYERQSEGSFLVFIPLFFFIILFLFIRRRKGFSPGHSSGPFFIGGLPFGSNSGGFGSFNSGSGSFGGFGGGSFGGGGASGSW